MSWFPVFEEITESSLNDEPVHVRWAFVVIGSKKHHRTHVARMDVKRLARLANITLEQAQEAYDILSSPDKNSFSEDHQGRRIIPVDGGWFVVTGQSYKDRMKQDVERNQAATRMAAKRERDAEIEKKTPQPVMTRKPGGAIEFGDGPTDAQCLHWLRDVQKNGADYTEKEMAGAKLALRAGGWMWGKNPVSDWRSALERQIQTDRTKVNHHGQSTGRPRVDANQNTLNDGGGINPSSLGRRHIKQVPDVSGSGADWNADGSAGVSGGAAPAQG